MLVIYNSLTKKKEPFKPITSGKVGLYVCGVTVYDFCHIGNARVMVVFDTIVRYLRSRGFEVNYVRNVTDIDDKIIHRAAELKISPEDVASKFTKIMHEDEASLDVLAPTVEPFATAHMDDMIKLIQGLLDKGRAYVAENGDVYYRVAAFETYGSLSHQHLDALRVGARVEVSDVKQDPLDFVLWKHAKVGEPAWEAPWGKGRPGWHAECSAMSMRHLGEHFDIHGGGMDLCFPHHENEIAQSEAFTGKKFVNTWMHVGFVQVNNEKMAKSLGNFFTVREVLARYTAEVIRYFMIASHYRSPLNYSLDNLESAHSALERFYLALRELPVAEESDGLKAYESRFNDAMDDDFNTPLALSVLFDLVKEINRFKEAGELDAAASLAAGLRRLAGSLGILQLDSEVFLRASVRAEEAKKIDELVDLRNAARLAKNWSEADRIRDQLHAMRVELEDRAGKTVWRFSSTGNL